MSEGISIGPEIEKLPPIERKINQEAEAKLDPNVLKTIRSIDTTFNRVLQSPHIKALRKEELTAASKEKHPSKQLEPGQLPELTNTTVQAYIDQATQEQEIAEPKKVGPYLEAVRHISQEKSPTSFALPKTEIATLETIRKLGQTREEILLNLEKNPRLASFEDLLEIVNAHDQDLERRLEMVGDDQIALRMYFEKRKKTLGE